MTTGERVRGRRGALGWALLAAALVAAPAGASDSDLATRVGERLVKAGLAQRGDVQVTVSDGVVKLDGFTLTVEARRAAEKAAAKESKRVDSRLVVRPLPVSEAELGKAVAGAILGEPRYGVFDSVGLELADGVVVLHGSVREPWLKDAIDRRVASVDGVREIRNEIRVQPTSLFDERLRAQLYRRIYGDELFYPYASWANPPIRIVVERGHVVLTGLVRSQVEQAKLGAIARGTLAFSVQNAVEVESEREKEPGSKTSQI